MQELTDEEHLNHIRETVRKWLEYFKESDTPRHRPEPKPDWEPLHIGFRGDDD